MLIRLFFAAPSVLVASFVIGNAQSHTVYTSAEEFEAELVASHTETFEEAANDWEDWGDPDTPVFSSSGNGFSFDLAADESNLHGYPLATMEDHNWEGSGIRNSTNNTDTAMIVENIDFEDPVTAVGGMFFYTRGNGVFDLEDGIRDMTMTVDFENDGPITVIHDPSDFSEAFFGVTSNESNPITSFTFVVNDGAGNRYTTTSEITVGVIPEPAAAGLVLAAGALGLVFARRRTAKARA